MSGRTRRITIGLSCATAGLLVAGALTISSAASARVTTAPIRASFGLAQGSSAAHFVSGKAIAGGDRLERWQSGGVTVLAAAPPGSTIGIHASVAANGSGDAVASVSTPSIDKTVPDAAAKAVAAYAASGQSVYAQALAVGADPRWAAKVAAAAGQSIPASARLSPSVSIGSIIGSACVNASGDGNNAFGVTCVVQKLLSTSGATWYIGDEISGSANDTGILHDLTRFHAWDSYPSGNGIVQWNPQSTKAEGSCKTVSASLSINGVSVSESGTVCPDRLDPTPYPHGFGTEWSGCDKHRYVEGAPSVDIDQNGPTASTTVTAWSYIHWDLLC